MELRMLGRIVVILRPRVEHEVGECDGEYRYAEEESIDDPLHLFFGLSLVRRKPHQSGNDFSACLVRFHLAGSLAVVVPRSKPLRSPRIICQVFR